MIDPVASRVLHRSTRQPLPVAVGGQGLTLTLGDGRTVLDASGGAAVSCLGHGHPRVTAAITRQLEAVAYANTSFYSSAPAEALAECLVGGEPGGLARAHFVSSGSEAVEACLKMARQYFVEIGEPERLHVIGRRQSYHGNTLGALSVGGHAARRRAYEPMLLPHVSFVSPCFAFRYKAPGEASAAYVARLADELEAECQRVGPGRVMAVIAEPVVGATSGAVAAEPGYFAAVREICDRHGALLILDEVMCGMGRCGTRHAWEQEGVVPDLQAVAKGLGAGYLPLGAMLVSRRVSAAIAAGSGVVAHGQTFQAHPVACAAALEVQRVIEDEGLLDHVVRAGWNLAAALADRFAAHPHVGDIRGRGLFRALEFVADRESLAPFDPALRFADRLKHIALEHGLAIYPSGGTIDGLAGDHAIVAPPYTVGDDDIAEIVSRLGRAVDATVAALER
ncbi:MAG: aspartate aminotransferase family protein [Vicinamibacterales bacterium]